MLVLQRNVAEIEDQIGDEDDLAVLYLLSFSIYYFHIKSILFIFLKYVYVYEGIHLRFKTLQQN